MKILINVPPIYMLGGVSNHYLGLKSFWNENVKYNTIGKRSKRGGSGKYWLPWDIMKFILRLLTFRPDVVLLNPSLGRTALIRDFLFLRLSTLLGFKTAVFIHGFDRDYAKSIDTKWVRNNLNRASLVFVLANAFRKQLTDWGVSTKIVLSTTKVDDKMLKGYDINNRTGEVRNILFLARIERAKGVFIAVDTYRILKEKYPNLTLTIAGDGSDLQNIKDYVRELGLRDVNITGRLVGQEIVEAYKKADLSSSSSYGEGMPTAVLEAMAFGLPIFTRYVGGLTDFFENGKMGFITNSLDAKDFADAMEQYILDKELTRRVARYNHQYALEHFMASKVAINIERELANI